ncbi:MAG: UDP-N-acetylmuramate--L-alanine ligase [Methyloligellaceae bacterium]
MNTQARKTGRYHIIGIGGIGMSAIAEVMQACGYDVQGSDQNKSANVERLLTKNIRVFVGHDIANIADADTIVISSAVKSGNPEYDAARARGLNILSRADMLAEIVSRFQTISITGTHGKTTTTSLIAHLLEIAGVDPTVINGGIINDWGSNARIGKGDWMVVEADESDGTFIRLPSRIGVVTNIDPEHLDYYGSVDALHEAFRKFFAGFEDGGLVVAGTDHPVVRQMISEIAPTEKLRILTYGQNADADILLQNWTPNGYGTTFNVRTSDDVAGGPETMIDLGLSIPGRYNAMNALAAIAVAKELGLGNDDIRRGLEQFAGVGRRFMKTGVWNGIDFYDDYAHHPVEIAQVLEAARQTAKRRVIAIVQPHRYSRLKDLLDEFSRCFSEAHSVIVAPVYTAGEAPNGIDEATLVQGLKESGHPHVLSVGGVDELAGLIAEISTAGDLVIGLGAGTISQWMNQLPSQLEELPAKLENFA